jgi:hypothetical protein
VPSRNNTDNESKLRHNGNATTNVDRSKSDNWSSNVNALCSGNPGDVSSRNGNTNVTSRRRGRSRRR